MSFGPDDFAAMLRAYPPDWQIDLPPDVVIRVRHAPPHVLFEDDARAVRVDDPTSIAPADRAFVDPLYARIRDEVVRLARGRYEEDERMRALAENVAFARPFFDELLASDPVALGWSIRIDDTDSVMPQRASWHAPANVLFVRRLKREKPDVQEDFVRVWVYDVEGVLRTTARTDEERAFAAALALAARPALDRMLAERADRVAKAIATAPKIDRFALEDAVRAMTHGKVDPVPIVEAVLLATTDPSRYVAENARTCAEWGVFEPIAGLHVVALLQRLPRVHLLYFDAKESMHEVLPMFADLLRAGPGIAFDVTPFAAKCDAWDRRARRTAMKELGAAIEGAALLEITTESDARSFVCVVDGDVGRIRAWTRAAHLPLKSYSTRGAAR